MNVIPFKLGWYYSMIFNLFFKKIHIRIPAVIVANQFIVIAATSNR